MKKMNHKQIEWSRQKACKYGFKKFGLLFSYTLLLLFVVSAIFALYDVKSAVDCVLLGGSTIKLLSMAAIGDIDDDSDVNSQAGQWAYEVKFIETSQVDPDVAFPVANSSREVSDISLLDGEVPHRFVSHSRPTYSGTGELNDYTIDPSKEIQIVLANAFREKVLDFVETKSGAKFLVFFRKIETSQWYMMGSLDQPLAFSSYEVKGDNEASVAICKFTNKSIRQYYKYTGALSNVAADTIAADSTNLTVTDNDRYQLTDNTGATAIATVSGIAPADYGRTITVYGSGGSYPATIADNTVFTLVNSETWTANAGSKISFYILDSGTLVEINGSRIQTA